LVNTEDLDAAPAFWVQSASMQQQFKKHRWPSICFLVTMIGQTLRLLDHSRKDIG
jgi:hypothetical protein